MKLPVCPAKVDTLGLGCPQSGHRAKPGLHPAVAQVHGKGEGKAHSPGEALRSPHVQRKRPFQIGSFPLTGNMGRPRARLLGANGALYIQSLSQRGQKAVSWGLESCL